MKNINPVSPAEEIVPDAGPSRFATVQSAANNASSPAAAIISEMPAPIDPSQPTSASVQPSAIAPAAAQPSNQSDSLYPQPLSSDQRQTQNHAALNPSPKDLNTAISQYFIPVIVGMYSLYILWTLVKAMFTGTTAGLLGSGVFGSWGTYYFLMFLAGLFQYSILLYASYQIYRGSKAGLALVTGACLLILPQYLLTFALFSSGIGIFFESIESGFQTVTIISLSVLLIYAWTKERSAYA